MRDVLVVLPRRLSGAQVADQVPVGFDKVRYDSIAGKCSCAKGDPVIEVRLSADDVAIRIGVFSDTVCAWGAAGVTSTNRVNLRWNLQVAEVGVWGRRGGYATAAVRRRVGKCA